ncbi:MAG: ATPase, partial [Devosia nanyangense]|nr:ATPase [Devosia nanyangense]
MPAPLTVSTPSEREIAISRDFDAPRDLVFLCYSRPDLIRRWLGPPDWT